MLPWLCARLRDAQGRDRNPLSPVAQWWILDRVRHGVVPLAALALLLCAWFALPRPASWTACIAGVSILRTVVSRAASTGARRHRRAHFASALRQGVVE